MSDRYVRPLKVATPEGKQIQAYILVAGERRIIEIAYLKEVQKDDPPFACNGQIRFSCSREKYLETIKILERYLENIFLKGMADEDIYSSLGAKPKRRRTKKQNISKEIDGYKRKGDSSSIHDSSGGAESAESIATGDSGDEVAEDNNPEAG